MIGLAENGMPQPGHCRDVAFHFLARNRRLRVGRQPFGVLQAAELAIGVAGRLGLGRIDQTQFTSNAQQGDIAQVPG